jgi:amidohydrolase
MVNVADLKSRVSEIVEEITLIRRHLHSHPELSFEEENTAKYISKVLNSWGINHQTKIGGFGIVGIIEGKNPSSKIIALRADMDALPIVEENKIEYRSLTFGKMHACGHDVHMTCLLGALKILNQIKNEFEGSIKFIFQPAEEVLPGGAFKMIEEGVLENPKPELIIAQHVFPEYEVGTVGFKSGIYMASSDEVNLKICGKGGHSAIPATYDNTVLAASQILVELDRINQQEKPKNIPSVLAFGKFIANGAYNVIPSEVNISGTFRTFSEKWRNRVYEILNDVSFRISKKHNCICEVNITKGYPVLVNNESVTEKSKLAAQQYLGVENVKELNIRTTVEDFARFAEIIPACFYRLGVANTKKGLKSNLHTSTFNIDEESLEIGTGLMVWIVLHHLETKIV